MDAKRASVESNATTTSVVALQQQIEEAMAEASSNASERDSLEPAALIAEPVGEDEEQAEEEDGSEGTGVDAVACAGRRVAVDLPRASAAAGRARPSLLLRMPYSTLLKVTQQLPRAARVSLCVTCRELCRLLGRGPGGRWDAEAAVLRRLVFDGWSASFFDDRTMHRLRTQRRKQQESAQREKEEQVRDSPTQASAALPSAQYI